jgi:hypothetical protein
LLVGKTVIDTCNYFPPRDGSIPEFEAQELTDSASAHIQWSSPRSTHPAARS